MLHTNSRGVNVAGADLYSARLEGANLRHVDQRETDLTGATLEAANLEGAQSTDEQLDGAGSLEGAVLHDGTRHA